MSAFALLAACGLPASGPIAPLRGAAPSYARVCPDSRPGPSDGPWEIDTGRCIEGHGLRVALARRHVSAEDAAGAPLWDVDIDVPMSAALADDGDVLVDELVLGAASGENGIVHRLARDGRERWRAPACGGLVGIGYEGTVAVACYGMLVVLDANGRERWRRELPPHDARLLLDREGRLFVFAAELMAFAPNGDLLWQLPPGPNRTIWRPGVDTQGRLLFRTLMSELHSNEPDGSRVYYAASPPELWAVDRADGRVATRVVVAPPFDAWPAHTPPPLTGTRRVP